MKNPLLIFVVLICLSYNSFSQSPQSFKYQTVVRDNSGNILQNQNIAFRISIQQSTAFTDVYVETHAVTTNNFGLANLEIGTGTIVSGDFASIDWGSDISYLQVEIDTSGGTGFQIMGVSQLLSVPYALYSEKSGNGSLWQQGSNGIYYDTGNVGVGTIMPNGKLQVSSDTAAGINDVIFSVLNANGDTVFAVYQEGVRIWVDDNGGTKANGSRGGFAVGGFSPTKAGFTNEYLRVTPDSVRVYIDDSYIPTKANGSRGGFAVGGFNPAKGTVTDNYFFVQDDSSRVWTNGDGGFGIMDLATGSTNYLNLTPNNYFIGHESGDSITIGLYNSFIGYQAGISAKTSGDNVFMGYKAGFLHDQILGRNVFIGKESGYSNSGISNCFIGYRTGYLSTSGQYNVGIGSEAFYNTTFGSNNVAIGNQTLYSNTTGNDNSGIGYRVLYSNTTGSRNVAIGNQTLYLNDIGNGNVAIGYYSLYSNTSGNNNVSLGYGSLFANTTGSNNTAIGNNSFTSGATFTNSTTVGANASMSASNKIRFGNGTVTVVEGPVAYTILSDKRFKNNITEEVKGLDFINRLRPVVYNFDTRKYEEFMLKDVSDNLKEEIMSETDYSISTNIRQSGFIAQEVVEAARESGYNFNGVHTPENDGDNYSVAYSLFTVPLVKAVQEQQKQIEELKAEIKKLKEKNK